MTLKLCCCHTKVSVRALKLNKINYVFVIIILYLKLIFDTVSL